MSLTTRCGVGAMVAVLVAAPLRPISAQVAPVRVGDTVSGTLSTEDKSLADGRVFQVYRFDALAGRHYEIVLRSEAFDVYLKVGVSVGAVTDYVAEDDDSYVGKSFTDAGVRFRAANSGPCLIVVTSSDRGGSSYRGGVGAFSLELKEIPQRLPQVRTLAQGDSATGRLSKESAITDDMESYYDVYTFHGRAGQTLRVAARSDSISVLVDIGRMENGRFVGPSDTLAPDSPMIQPPRRRYTGRGRSSRTFAVTTDQEYAVRVQGSSRNAIGPYIITLTESPALHPHSTRPRVIRRGDRLMVTIAPIDSPAVSTRGQHDWIYKASKGERLIIDMRSADFDPNLSIGTSEKGTMKEPALASDDDSGENNDARLVYVVPDSGEYVIRAGAAYGLYGDAEYELSLNSRPSLLRRLESRRIVAHRQVNGTLNEADEILDDGSAYDEWIYSAMARDTVTITLRSTDFDTFLSVGQLRGGQFFELSNNDDAESDTDSSHVSELRVVPPNGGDLIIRVNTFGPEQGGAYTLQLRRGARAIADRETP